jgi:hypothetical protein
MVKAMKTMRVLLTMPHVFAPRKDSLYSSQTEAKRETKKKALEIATRHNLSRHHQRHWIHASLGKGRPVVTREMKTPMGIDLTIQLYTQTGASLSSHIEESEHLAIIATELSDLAQMPMYASRRLIEQAEDYDIVGYLEDDILIEDVEFFHKISYLVEQTNNGYAFMPHRCEEIQGRGDVILSGDPDGGRPDLFWDTGEQITIPWPLGDKKFYRATNPHSGCYFLTRSQAVALLHFWERRSWKADFQLSGPLEQAASGLLLPVFKIMKPMPEHYRFLMVRHQDKLWERHPFEYQSNS